MKNHDKKQTCFRKRLIACGICTAFLAAAIPMAQPVYAAAPNTEKEIVFEIQKYVPTESERGTYEKLVESKKIAAEVFHDNNFTLDKTLKQKPIIVQNRTFVPLREIFEAMGCKVTWDAKGRSAILSNDTASVTLTVGNKTMSVKKDGKTTETPLDAAPLMENGTLMLPVKAPAKALGWHVAWHKAVNNPFLYMVYSDADGILHIPYDTVEIYHNGNPENAPKHTYLHRLKEIDLSTEEAEKQKKAMEVLQKLDAEYKYKGSQFSEEEFEAEVLKCINAVRAVYDLEPLIMDSVLQKGARVRAKELFTFYNAFGGRPNGEDDATVLPASHAKVPTERLGLGTSADSSPAFVLYRLLRTPDFHPVFQGKDSDIAGVGFAKQGNFSMCFFWSGNSDLIEK